MKTLTKTTYFLSLLLLSPLLHCKGMDDKINEFFDSFNTRANNSDPTYINSQLGVHFLGGGGTVRTGVYDINPIHTTLPNISAGCGGIDYTLGGINIASKEEMKNALKSIASNGVGYAFLLGIETVSPVIASTMKQVQTWANQLNAINVNSCELATSLVQGAWPKSQRASSYICEHAATTNPLFKDLIEAKHGCRDDHSKRQQAVNKAQSENHDMLVGNYNIAWKALEKFQLDEETKNLFMNITGTIVVQEMPNNPKEGKKVSVYPPQYKKAVDLIRFGGQLNQAYKIEKNQTDVRIDILTIKPELAWKSKIYKTLLSLQQKILLEQEQKEVSISEDEKNIISTTHFPIGSLLSLMSQYNGKGAIIALDRYSDLIAFERVLKFAENIVRDTLSQAEALRSAQISGYELDEYIKQITLVLRDLQTMNIENIQNISAEHQMIDYLIKIDRHIRDQERGI
ncbi:MAG TPA: conjugal transfer protein TraH [Rhabdochlamydiaceae bacterium]|nr:conjugal transfer protein TraH [Rhabdochlamydiaceae bacterium]